MHIKTKIESTKASRPCQASPSCHRDTQQHTSRFHLELSRLRRETSGPLAITSRFIHRGLDVSVGYKQSHTYCNLCNHFLAPFAHPLAYHTKKESLNQCINQVHQFRIGKESLGGQHQPQTKCPREQQASVFHLDQKQQQSRCHD